MINRTAYALRMAWQYHKTLSTYCKDPTLQCKSVLELEPARLQQQGFKGIILDMDGVLSTHGEETLSPEIFNWLKAFVKAWPVGRVFVLSNKPDIERVKYFAKNFEGLKFILPLRKKPYPDSILHVLQITHIQPQELLVVDDRLLTGVLAAIIANTPARYITNPLISLEKRPITESFFIVLRALERFVFTYF